MATASEAAQNKPNDPKGGNAVLEGLGAIVNRGSLTTVQRRIKEAENLLGPKTGTEKKKSVTNALIREATRKAPALQSNPNIPAFVALLTQITFDEMKKAGELDAPEEA